MDSWWRQEFAECLVSGNGDEADEEIILVAHKEGDKLSVYPRALPDFTEQPQVWQTLLLRYVNLETGQDFDSQEQMMANNVHDIGGIIAKFITRFNCRSIHSFLRPKPRSVWQPRPNQGQDWPLPSGVFKGTYGPHGIEIISVHYSNDSDGQKLVGLKLTGDPNVPMGNVSFRGDLRKSIILTEDFQRDVTCDQLVEAVEAVAFIADRNTDTYQPFVMPMDAFQRRQINYTTATHRYMILRSDILHHFDVRTAESGRIHNCIVFHFVSVMTLVVM